MAGGLASLTRVALCLRAAFTREPEVRTMARLPPAPLIHSYSGCAQVRGKVFFLNNKKKIELRFEFGSGRMEKNPW